MDIDEIIIGNILKLLERHGMTQKELASKAKINYQNLNRLLKRGRSISKSDVLPLLAEALQTSVTSLHTYRDSKNPDLQKSHLITNIITVLPTLNESQLRSVSDHIEAISFGDDLIKSDKRAVR